MRYGSLFTGAGGLDLAVHQLWPDADLAWWSEVDPHAAASFARNTDAPNLGDITAIDWGQVEPVDMIVGGFPCTNISSSGKKDGVKEGNSSGLWFEFADAIGVLRPRLVLLENVSTITHRGGVAVVGSLAACGYDARWCTVRASDLGAPHGRNRWFAFAHPIGGRAQVPTVRELAAIEEPWGAGAEGRARLNLLPTPTAAASRAARSATSTGRPTDWTLDDVRYANRWGDYAGAIARWEPIVGRPAPDPTDDKGRLSPEFVEWMMGWPEGWTHGSRSQRLKMIGNGVVPQQAVAAYRSLLEVAA